MSGSCGETAIHRELARDREPTVQVVEMIAEIEGRQMAEMTPAYNYLGTVLEQIFSDPPAPDAEVEITFSYEGYRITIEQDGRTRILRR